MIMMMKMILNTVETRLNDGNILTLFLFRNYAERFQITKPRNITCRVRPRIESRSLEWRYALTATTP